MWVIIDSGIGLPVQCQAITWTNVDLLLSGPLKTKLRENLIKIWKFSVKKMHVKKLSAQCWPFCVSPIVLLNWRQMLHLCISKLYYHWFRSWLVSCLVPIHYLNQSWDFSVRPSGTYFSWILFKIERFSFRKMHLKIFLMKWWPFFSVLSVLSGMSDSVVGCQSGVRSAATLAPSQSQTALHLTASVKVPIEAIVWLDKFVDRR